MTLINSINGSVGGMKAHTQALGTISNNLSNSNTNGYKSEDSSFNAIAIDSGVVKKGDLIMPFHESHRTHDKQGALRKTESPNDISIVGKGFFTLHDTRNNKEVFTRDGRFELLESGQLVHASSKMPLLGVKIERDQSHKDIAIQDSTDIIIDTKAYIAKETNDIKIAGNLPSNADIGQISKMRTFIFDKSGKSHPIDIIFTKENENIWRISYDDSISKDIKLVNALGDNKGKNPELMLNNHAFKFFTNSHIKYNPLGFSNIIAKKISADQANISMLFGTDDNKKIFESDINIKNKLSNEKHIKYDNVKRMNQSSGYDVISVDSKPAIIESYDTAKLNGNIKFGKVKIEGIDPLKFSNISNIDIDNKNASIIFDFESQQYKLNLQADNKVSSKVMIGDASSNINGNIYGLNITNGGNNIYKISMKISDGIRSYDLHGDLSHNSDILYMKNDIGDKFIKFNMSNILDINDKNINSMMSDLSENFHVDENSIFSFNSVYANNVTYDGNEFGIQFINPKNKNISIFKGKINQDSSDVFLVNDDNKNQSISISFNKSILENIINNPENAEQSFKNYIIGQLNIMKDGKNFIFNNDSNVISNIKLNIRSKNGIINDIKFNQEENVIEMSVLNDGQKNIYVAKLSDDGILKNNQLIFNNGIQSLVVNINPYDKYNTNNKDQRDALVSRLEQAAKGLEVIDFQFNNQTEKAMKKILNMTFNKNIEFNNGALNKYILDDNNTMFDGQGNTSMILKAINGSGSIKIDNILNKYKFNPKDIQKLSKDMNDFFDNSYIKNGSIYKIKNIPTGQIPELTGKVYDITSEGMHNGNMKLKLTIQNNNEFIDYYGSVNIDKMIDSSKNGLGYIVKLANGKDLISFDIKSSKPMIENISSGVQNESVKSVEWEGIEKDDQFNNIKLESYDKNTANILLESKKGLKFFAKINLEDINDINNFENSKILHFSNGTQSFKINILKNKFYAPHTKLGMDDMINDLNEYIQNIEIKNWTIHDKSNNSEFSIDNANNFDPRGEQFKKIFTTQNNGKTILNVKTDSMNLSGEIGSDKILLQDGNFKILMKMNNNKYDGSIINDIRKSFGLGSGMQPLRVNSSGNLEGAKANIFIDMLKESMGIDESINTNDISFLKKPKNVIVESINDELLNAKVFFEDDNNEIFEFNSIINKNNIENGIEFNSINSSYKNISLNIKDIINNAKNSIITNNVNISGTFNSPEYNGKFNDLTLNNEGTIMNIKGPNCSFSIDIPSERPLVIDNNYELKAYNGDQEIIFKNMGSTYTINNQEDLIKFNNDFKDFVSQYLIINEGQIQQYQNARFSINSYKNLFIENGILSNFSIDENNNAKINMNNIILTGKIDDSGKLKLKNGNYSIDLQINNNISKQEIENSINNSNNIIYKNQLNNNLQEQLRNALYNNAVIDINGKELNNSTKFDSGSTINNTDNIIKKMSKINFGDDFYLTLNTEDSFNLSSSEDINKIGNKMKNAFSGRVIKDNVILNDISSIYYDSSGNINSIQNPYQSNISQISENGFNVKIKNMSDPNQIYMNDISVSLKNHDAGFGEFIQLNGEYKIDNIEQDGMGYGEYIGHEFDENGILKYKYSNGYVEDKYKLPLSVFINPAGLDKVSNNIFQHSNKSGQGDKYWSNQGSAGFVAPNSLELSNVDITDNMVRMIKYQQAFSASAKILTASDEMIKTAIEVKR